LRTTAIIEIDNVDPLANPPTDTPLVPTVRIYTGGQAGFYTYLFVPGDRWYRQSTDGQALFFPLE